MCKFGLQTMIKEEERLAAVLADIDNEVRIVPRGAYVKTPTGQVYENRSFEGMLPLLFCCLSNRGEQTTKCCYDASTTL